MTHDEHKHHHDHDHHHGHQNRKSKGLHKDWRTWLVVGLMLAAMLAYVLSMDESLAPVNRPESAYRRPTERAIGRRHP